MYLRRYFALSICLFGIGFGSFDIRSTAGQAKELSRDRLLEYVDVNQTIHPVTNVKGWQLRRRSVVDAMVTMIELARRYEMQVKVMSTANTVSETGARLMRVE